MKRLLVKSPWWLDQSVLGWHVSSALEQTRITVIMCPLLGPFSAPKTLRSITSQSWEHLDVTWDLSPPPSSLHTCTHTHTHTFHLPTPGTVILNPNSQDSPSIRIKFQDYGPKWPHPIVYPKLESVLEVASDEMAHVRHTSLIPTCIHSPLSLVAF